MNKNFESIVDLLDNTLHAKQILVHQNKRQDTTKRGINYKQMKKIGNSWQEALTCHLINKKMFLLHFPHPN